MQLNVYSRCYNKEFPIKTTYWKTIDFWIIIIKCRDRSDSGN